MSSENTGLEHDRQLLNQIRALFHPISDNRLVAAVERAWCVRTNEEGLRQQLDQVTKDLDEHVTALAAAIYAQNQAVAQMEERAQRLRAPLARVRKLNKHTGEPVESDGRAIERLVNHLHQVERELYAAKAEIEATWSMIEQEYDLESRTELEQEASRNGFMCGLAQAIHHLWKRDVKVEALHRLLAQGIDVWTRYGGNLVSDQWIRDVKQVLDGPIKDAVK